MSEHVKGISGVVVDSADPAALAAFWQRLLGGEVEVDADGDAVLHGLPVELVFVRVPEAKTGKNRLHLDLGSSDLAAAVADAIAAGATRVDDVHRGERWVVLRDPEGNEFCVLRPGVGAL